MCLAWWRNDPAVCNVLVFDHFSVSCSARCSVRADCGSRSSPLLCRMPTPKPTCFAFEKQQDHHHHHHHAITAVQASAYKSQLRPHTHPLPTLFSSCHVSSVALQLVGVAVYSAAADPQQVRLGVLCHPAFHTGISEVLNVRAADPRRGGA